MATDCDRSAAQLCAGKVGAVLCFDASWLARNGRGWHHLLELCDLVEARVIDQDGIYNPCRPNDRLLFGMKGSISGFELGVLRACMMDAARAQAKWGELVSVGAVRLCLASRGGLGVRSRSSSAARPPPRGTDPARLREFRSARRVHLSMVAKRIHFPRPSDEGRMTSPAAVRGGPDDQHRAWLPIRYRNVISIVKNPFYAGVYAYGKGEKRTEIVEARARKSSGHGKPIGTWDVMIKDHHEGYIGWAEYERNQKQLASNTYGWSGGAKSSRGGGSAVVGDFDLRAVRPPSRRVLFGQPTEPSGVPLRQAEPYDGPAAMHDLWRAARGRRNR